MKIVSYTKPEAQIVHQVRELEQICQAHDGLKGSLFLDPSLNVSPDAPCLIAAFEGDALVGAITFFAPTREEAEIVGLTRPGFRGSGVFRALSAAAAQSALALGISELLFVCEPQSVGGAAVLQRWQLPLDHTEYALRYDRAQPPERIAVPDGLTLHQATQNDVKEMVNITQESFADEAEQAERFLTLALVSKTRRQYIARLNDAPVAIGALGFEDGEATLYGLGVRSALQNKGIGRGLVGLLVRESYAQGVEDILIEVDSTNARAYHLYRSCGFFAEATYDYFRTKIDPFLPKEA